MEYGRKEFHFDLDVDALKRFYPSDHPNAWKSAWSEVKAFMEEHGFEHSQYSGYESRDEMTYDKAYAVLFELNIAYPWFSKCAQAATLTEIGERHDVLEYLRAQDQPPEGGTPRRSQTPRTPSLAGEARDARRASGALDNGRGSDPSRDMQR